LRSEFLADFQAVVVDESATLQQARQLVGATQLRQIGKNVKVDEGG
jgi:hypothetical protein